MISPVESNAHAVWRVESWSRFSTAQTGGGRMYLSSLQKLRTASKTNGRHRQQLPSTNALRICSRWRKILHSLQQHRADQRDGVEAHAGAIRAATAAQVVGACLESRAVGDRDVGLATGQVDGGVARRLHRVQRQAEVTAGLLPDAPGQFLGELLGLIQQGVGLLRPA